MAQALEIAQRALDLEAAQGRKLLSFPRVDEQHIVWGRDSAHTVLRLVVSPAVPLFGHLERRRLGP
jgi:hypothetical protein